MLNLNAVPDNARGIRDALVQLAKAIILIFRNINTALYHKTVVRENKFGMRHAQVRGGDVKI